MFCKIKFAYFVETLFELSIDAYNRYVTTYMFLYESNALFIKNVFFEMN